MINTSPTGLGTLGHPGIFIGQAQDFFGLRNHLDIPYVTSLAPNNSLDFGVLDLWALKQRTDSPLLTMAIDNAQVRYTDADSYTFELPNAGDMTTRLISGGLDKDKMGMDMEEIPFVVSKRDLSPGAIFKFALESRISFTVVDRVIEEVGKYFKLWAYLNTNSQVKYVTKAEFEPMRQIIKLADVRSLDFSSYKSVWQISDMGNAKYKNYLSNAMLQQSYRVTSGAVEYLNHQTRFTGAKMKQMENAVMQFYSIKGMAENKVIDLRNADNYKQWFERIQDEKAKGNGERAMVNLLDAISIDMMQAQNNNLLIWSDAINQLRDGYDTMRLVPGIWFQMDMAGYKHSFSIDTFTLDTLTNAIKDFEYGKVALRDSVSTTEYVIKTGKGGQKLIYKMMMAAGFNIPGQVQNAEFGFITGSNAANLTYNLPRFVRYQIPDIGYIRVEYEPGFDPILQDERTNPILADGYRLSSYTMLIEDYDMSKDNIVILRHTGNRFRMRVEAGDETHPLFRHNHNIGGQNITAHQSTDELTGYEVKFSSKADSAVVIDPTKLLKLVPKNPRTGLASL